MKLYSLDLRQKLVGAVDSGLSHQEVADRFDVSTDTVSRYLKPRGETGNGAIEVTRMGWRRVHRGAKDRPMKDVLNAEAPEEEEE